MLIMEKDMMDTWKKLAVGGDSLGDGGSENVSMALEMIVILYVAPNISHGLLWLI